jgi:predicted deacylase
MQESGDTITIGDVKVAPGEIKHIKLKISESFFTSPIVMPVSVINGVGDGPRLLLSAASHGDEVNGVGIVRELIYSIDHTNFNGMLICVPVMNITGFLNHTRYLPDGRDLNRNFPGRPDGNPAQRIAYTIFTEVISKCDFALDFHTAGDGRANMIQVRADMRDSNVKRIAKAFGSEIIIDSEGLPGTLRRSAAQSGIPTITIEAGEPHKFERKVVKQCLQGIMNVIYELGMMKGTIVEPRFQVVVKKTEWVRADRGGILEMKTYPRSLEKEGNELCVITNPFGVEVGIVRAPFTGMVVGVTTRPVASPGSPICHMVKIDKTLYKVEQAIRKKAEEVEKVHGLTELLQEIKSEEDIAEIELQLQKLPLC